MYLHQYNPKAGERRPTRKWLQWLRKAKEAVYNKATDEDHSKRRNTQAAQSKNRGHSVLDPEHEQLQNTPYTTDNIQHATHNTENTQYSQKSQYPIRNQQLLIQYSNPTRIAYLGNTIKCAFYTSMNFQGNIKKYQENIFKIIRMMTRRLRNWFRWW